MRIYPATHYTMRGLWVDYNLHTTNPGLFAGGEANFSDHGANRLGASALMQGLADGYFVIPYTLGNYLAGFLNTKVGTTAPEFTAALKNVQETTKKLVGTNGKRSAAEYHRDLGKIMWDKCGMARTDAGLKQAIDDIRALKAEFWKNINVPGSHEDLNQALERAGRVADFFELGEVMCRDALAREESCGGHFREEHQDENGEAQRDDENFQHAAAWRYTGEDTVPERLVEPLEFEYVKPTKRSYK
jgi:succinate dehydrogenase / fumarate reductase flavoprotein subunit